MIFNILAKREGGLWVAHCLELDLVATANELETVKNDMLALIKTQVAHALSNDNLENLYHPAHPPVWKKVYGCHRFIENEIEVKSGKKPTLKAFVRPWIIANTCVAEEASVV